MNVSFVLFLLFAIAAVALKLISAWIPIDIMIAFSLWTGLRIKSSNRLSQKFLLSLCLVGIFVLSDYLFSILYTQQFLYPGFVFNHIALVSGAVFAGLTPNSFQTRAWGLWGISSATLLFFVLSNLGVFFFSPLYPQTVSGLEACFIAALPFLKVQWISNSVGLVSLFWIEQKLFSNILLKQNP